MLDRLIDAREARLAQAYRHVKQAGPPSLGLHHLSIDPAADDVTPDVAAYNSVTSGLATHEAATHAAASPGSTARELAALEGYARRHIGDSARFFALPHVPAFEYRDGWLRFDSALPSGSPGNDRVCGRFRPGRGGRAVVLLGHWNAPRASYARLARVLAASGIGCLQLSLPFHDERATPGVGWAREMASEDVGLTIRTHRQAVVDVRAAVAWLHATGHGAIGLLGSSLGSSIAAVSAAHEPRVRALSLILMADDLAEVIWTGSATAHLRAALETRFSLADVQKGWALISPNTYAARLARLGRVQIVSARVDSVFLPPLTERYVARLHAQGLLVERTCLGCGHYSMASFPFNLRCLATVARFLRRSLPQ